LEEVLCGEAFEAVIAAGSFCVVINQSVTYCDELKEAPIGVELFGRSPSYDTGEDAIVRVTASDVRRRLLHTMGGTHRSEFRISLPLGPIYLRSHEMFPVKMDALEESGD